VIQAATGKAPPEAHTGRLREGGNAARRRLGARGPGERLWPRTRRRARTRALFARLCRLYPGLAIAGVEVPPFRPMTPDEHARLIERIRTAASGSNL
jgi:hypothetical protein